MPTTKEVRVPDLGDFADVEIIELLVAPGDRVTRDQSLVTLESDKATMEIPAPFGGIVRELRVRVGDRINPDDLLMILEDAPSDPEAPAVSEPAPEEPQGSEVVPRESDTEAREVDVLVPDLGDFADVEIIECLVAPGDRVTRDQSLVTLESDKATMEIPAPQAGTVGRLIASVGDRVSQGDRLLTLIPETDSEAAPPKPPSPPPEKSPEPPPPGEAPRRKPPILPRPEDLASLATGRKPHASPAVRRFARELGADLSQVKGTGPKGRILKEDVQRFIQQALIRSREPATQALPFSLAAPPDIDYARFGPVEVRELPRIKKRSGQHLHRCWLSVPHVTQFDQADITDLEAFRKAHKEAAAAQGVRLTFLPFVLKAVAKALDQMPLLKASLTGDGERLVWKQFTHIGVAVDTPNGLLVPVIRDVDTKGLYDLARELGELSQKAREGTLLPADLQGGVFSISSLGGIGGTAFTPIVNAPEAAILGVSRAEMKPVWNGREFIPRLLVPLSLSYDHRIVDGAEGVRFTTLLGELLGDIRRLLL